MKSFLKHIEQSLARRFSRRSFVGKLGNLAAALATLTTSQVLGRKDTAYATDIKNILHCCEGTPCPDPKAKICPDNTIPLYTWSCLDSKNHHNYTCTDCFQLIKTTPHKVYHYTCTFASCVHGNQTQQITQTVVNMSTSCQSSKSDIVVK